ncbi:MAG TPA: hypothetical protein VGN28_13370 [Blastococcus sp.]|jgi:hypothetical protein|nr:hypothetical protein [Blastococcus sp.]
MRPALTPWPRLADAWWVYALGALALVLFPIGLITRLRCGLGRCTGSTLQHVFDLDAIGGLPRLFISGLFAAVAVLAWLARRRSGDVARTWWTAVAGIGAVLAVAKLVSMHSTAKHSAPLLTLAGGLLLTGLALGALTVTGRRWGIAAARPIAVTLGVYAAAALGLDAVTSAVAAAQDHVGALSAAASTFVEELGEALAALFVLVTVRWHLPAPPEAAPEDAVSWSGSSRR